MLDLEMEDLVDLQHVSLIHLQPLVILPMVMESDMNMEYSNNPLMAMGVRYNKHFCKKQITLFICIKGHTNM